MEKIKNLLAELSDSEFQAAAKPIEEKQNNGNFYFELTDKTSNERAWVCLSFHHQIYRDWFKTEFSYGVTIHLNDENGPLFPVDQINMEITREIDQSNYTVSSYNSAQAYHVRTFRAGPSGTSCLVPVVIYQGYEYRYVQMCQSANRDNQFEKTEKLLTSN